MKRKMVAVWTLVGMFLFVGGTIFTTTQIIFLTVQDPIHRFLVAAPVALGIGAFTHRIGLLFFKLFEKYEEKDDIE